MMRGVYLTAGEHTVDFRFQPSEGFLYVSLAGLGFGILLGAWLIRAHLNAGRVPQRRPDTAAIHVRRQVIDIKPLVTSFG